MWSLLEKITVQVTKYSTFLGQIWYVLVFLFRLIVVVTLGGEAYGDEQSAFKCSTKLVGCENICYDEFAKMSHLRFWSFQILAVTTPTVFFHFYTTYVSGEIQKLRDFEDELQVMEQGERKAMSSKCSTFPEKDFRKLSKRVKCLGSVKVRRIYVADELKEVPYTNKIHCAYYVSVILRIILEAAFLHLGFLLFNNVDSFCSVGNNACNGDFSSSNFLWMKVPAMYHCSGGPRSPVYDACYLHVSEVSGKTAGFVPCYVSRHTEKTIILRYMTVLSGICFFVSYLEFLILTCRNIRKIFSKKEEKKANRNYCQFHPSEFIFHPAIVPIKSYVDSSNFYPSLAAPVRMPPKNDNKWMEKPNNKRDEDKNQRSRSASIETYV